MEIWRVSGIAMIGLVALLVLKQYSPQWGSFLRISILVLVVGMLGTMVAEVVSFARHLSDGEVLPSGMWQLLLKALCISFLTEVTAGVCRDSGEGGVAQWVEAAGKLEILVLALPLVGEVLAMVKEFLGA